jgi:hypothetical protein
MLVYAVGLLLALSFGVIAGFVYLIVADETKADNDNKD